jgi:hypothetical protein
MIDDMTLHGLKPETNRAYVDGIARIARHFGKSPELLGTAEIRSSLLYLTATGTSPPAPPTRLFAPGSPSTGSRSARAGAAEPEPSEEVRTMCEAPSLITPTRVCPARGAGRMIVMKGLAPMPAGRQGEGVSRPGVVFNSS